MSKVLHKLFIPPMFKKWRMRDAAADLVTGPGIVFVPINVNAARNVRGLLFNGHQQVQSLMIES
jgi:hypothetical protein